MYIMGSCIQKGLLDCWVTVLGQQFRLTGQTIKYYITDKVYGDKCHHPFSTENLLNKKKHVQKGNFTAQ